MPEFKSLHAVRPRVPTLPAPTHSVGPPSAPYMVPAQELFTPAFLLRYTRHQDLESLLWAGGLVPEALLGLANSPSPSWDAFISRSSRFPDWSALLRQARGEWLVRRLGLMVDA